MKCTIGDNDKCSNGRYAVQSWEIIPLYIGYIWACLDWVAMLEAAGTLVTKYTLVTIGAQIIMSGLGRLAGGSEIECIEGESSGWGKWAVGRENAEVLLNREGSGNFGQLYE